MPEAPAYRIRKGESCLVAFWSSNATHTVSGTFRIRYDDGGEDDFGLNIVASAGARAVQYVYTDRVARQDGYVTELTVLESSSATLQRGECYAAAIIALSMRPKDFASAVSLLAADYLMYANHLVLGRIVSAGPAGGPGNQKAVNLGDPALAAQIGAQSVPAGALQLVRAINAPETAAGAATRNWSVQFTNGGGLIISEVGAPAELTGVKANLQAGIGVNTIANAGVDDNLSLPVLYLLATWTWQPILNGIAAADNIGASGAIVEEWVMPN
jgi:hypothetical protein